MLDMIIMGAWNSLIWCDGLDGVNKLWWCIKLIIKDDLTITKIGGE